MSKCHNAMLARPAIVSAARGWCGTPYHHQASMKGIGTDCLGLVRGVWRECLGHEPELPPPYSRDWAETNGGEVLLAAAARHLRETVIAARRPGDVIIFRHRAHLPAKHAGILTSSDTFVHAVENVPVAEVALSAWWLRRTAGVFRFPGVCD